MFGCHTNYHQKTWWIEFPSAKPWPNGMKSAHFFNGWWLGMRNVTNVVCDEIDRTRQYCAKMNVVKTRWSSSNGGQTRSNGKEWSAVHLVGLEKNYLLWVASIWPNTKFESLLSTTGQFEVSDGPETTRISHQKWCCVPSGQRQVYSDWPATPWAWLKSFNASTI